MSQKAGLLARLFPSRKANKKVCCGIEIEDDAAPAIVPLQASCACPASSAQAAHTDLGAAELSANHFLIRRAELLQGLHGNPYGIQIKERGRVKAILAARAPTPTLNRAFAVNLDDRDLVEELNDWFAGAHAAPAYQVLGMGDQPASAPDGFTKIPGWEHVILERGVELPADDGDSDGAIRVERVTKQNIETFVRIYAEAFNYPSAIVQSLCRSAEMLVGEPDVISYIATIADEPVSVGQLFLSTHGAAFLGSTGTIPAARRAGCQALLDRLRIADAKEAGFRLLCRTVAVNSQSWRNAMKVGFRTVCREQTYTPAAMMPATAGRQEEAGRDGCCTAQLPVSA